MLCPYCGRDKDAGEFTDEHVLPRALGGVLEPVNPFKIRVCGRCNHLSGQHVDGPFCKSTWMHYARASAGKSAVDLATEPTLPLTFIGALEAWSGPDVCDLWLGPTGDLIYHFHDAYEDRPTIVGKPIGRRKDVDPGVVFVGVVATNPAWHRTIVKSIKAEFSGAAVYYINLTHEGVGPPYPPVPDALVHKLEWAKALRGQQHEASFALDPNCGDRILAKFALGMGSLVLGAPFEASEQAAKLRQFLWTPSPDARAELQLQGTTFFAFEENQPLVELLSWRGCHVIALMVTTGNLVLEVCLYGRYAMATVLSSDPAVWSAHVPAMGKVWVVSPALRKHAGSMDFFEFYSDTRKTSPIGPLKQLGALIDAIPPLPPTMAADLEPTTTATP
jgi:HNH endonuclease